MKLDASRFSKIETVILQVYETLARRLSTAGAAQRLRLPEGASGGREGPAKEFPTRSDGALEGDEEHSVNHMLGVRPEELLRLQLERWPFSQVGSILTCLGLH